MSDNKNEDVLVSVPHAWRTINLAIEIADDAVELQVYSECVPIAENDLTWWRPMRNVWPDTLDRALEYLHLRGLIEYDSSGKLVRFVEGS